MISEHISSEREEVFFFFFFVWCVLGDTKALARSAAVCLWMCACDFLAAASVEN